MAASTLALLVAGCAAPLRVTPLATGQVAVRAYELRGDDPERLRAEALRLCGGTSATVLRESYASRELPVPDGAGRMLRAATAVQAALDPPRREAQLEVRCPTDPQRAELIARYTPAPVAEASRGFWSSLAFWRRSPEGATSPPLPSDAGSAALLLN